MEIVDLLFIHEKDDFIYGYNQNVCYMYNKNHVLCGQHDVLFPFSFQYDKASCAQKYGKSYYGLILNSTVMYKFAGFDISLVCKDAPVASSRFCASIFQKKLLVLDKDQNLHVYSNGWLQCPITLGLEKSSTHVHYFDQCTYLLHGQTVYKISNTAPPQRVIDTGSTPISVYFYKNLLFAQVKNSNLVYDLKSSSKEEVEFIPLTIQFNYIFSVSAVQRIDFESVQVDSASDSLQNELCFNDVVNENSALQILLERIQHSTTELGEQLDKNLKIFKDQNLRMILAKSATSAQKQKLLQSMKEINQLHKVNHAQVMNKYVLNGRYWEDQFENIE
ncbi:Hypothetical_protein [Hexamita inflata]|uniref:Hypothetical_protein n=1 Tax=Hexamita inflata TaxID=28002 RepID=A0ABP1GG37_9EUKA